jgi:UDP-N-acetylglucosamine:LPS N-acetylglucosamine transferase
MAHVLLGWEFGGNQGHATALLSLAGALRKRGHRVSFALQRVDAIPSDKLEGVPVWPAPVSPRFLINTSRPRSGHPQSMGDIVARLGFDDPALTEAMLRAWRQLLAAINPDLVISDYGPFLLLAARGHLPTIGSGTAFSTPPSVMNRFPSLTGEAPVFDEDMVIEATNLALRRTGLEPIERLPQIFEGRREIAGSFSELDPYAEWRRDPLVQPMLRGDLPDLAPGGGEEVFVYTPEQVPVAAPLWEGLARSGLPVRVFPLNASADLRQTLAAKGLEVETQPRPFAEIAERSRLLVSHGGHGFVCSALLAGLPQVICHFDLEKLIHARALTKLGLGGMVPMKQIEPDAFAASLVEVYRNEDLAARARAAAPGFRSRYDKPKEESVADAVDDLLS